MMMDNPLHESSNLDAPPAASTTNYQAFVNNSNAAIGRETISIDQGSRNVFTEQDWERIHLLEDYKPSLNGFLNEEYVDLKAKMQNELGVSAQVREDGKLANVKGTGYEFIHVPPEVVTTRLARVMETDKAVVAKARDNVYNLSEKAFDEIITKHGEEILAKIRCVAILNAPQTNQDHHGDCRLYLTRHQRDNVSFYRLFLYAYGETARYEAQETTEVIHDQQVKIFENMTFLTVQKKYGLQAGWEHSARRDVLAEFLTLSLEDILSLHHRVCDYTEMMKFAKNENLRHEEEKMIECQGCCPDLCPTCCQDCPTCPSIKDCCPQEFFKWKLWKWTMKEMKTIRLDELVCKEEIVYSTQPQVAVYDPYRQESVMMKSHLKQRTSYRRYHTLNFTCVDSWEMGKKFKTVVVLHPDEACSLAVDFVCQVNNFIDELRYRQFNKVFPTGMTAPTAGGSGPGGVFAQFAYRDWFLRLRMDSRSPYEENTTLVAGMKKFLGDLLSGGLYIEMEVTWPYYYNLLLLIFFSFIGMIVCFAAAATNGLYAVNGIYGLLHWGNRIYNLQYKEFVASTLYKDVGVTFFGLLLAGIAAALGPTTTTEAAAAAFTFLQAFFSFFGACYQLFVYVQKKTNGIPSSGGGGSSRLGAANAAMGPGKSVWSMLNSA